MHAHKAYNSESKFTNFVSDKLSKKNNQGGEFVMYPRRIGEDALSKILVNALKNYAVMHKDDDDALNEFGRLIGDAVLFTFHFWVLGKGFFYKAAQA